MLLTIEPERRAESFCGRVRKAQRFYLDDGPVASGPLTVIGGAHEFCSPDYVMSRDSLSCYSVEFVARGRGWLTLDGKGYLLDAGAVFSHGPGVSQRITTDSRDLLEKYCIDFTGSRASGILEDNGLAAGTVARVSSVTEVQEIFDNLIRDGLRGNGASNVLCAALSEYLIIKVADLVVREGSRPSRACTKFERCRQYIATHFRRLRSLGQIAEECEVDQAYLCRLFRRYVGQTPYQFLLRLKMNYAAERLRDPKMLVKEVAITVGFEDPFHFSHAFKNVFGTSPDVYRRS